MPKPLAGKRIVLGVTGGIAAYKAADFTSKLVQLGADVHVLMSKGALEFVRPMTFQALTRNPVFTSVFDGWQGMSAGHVTLAATADLVIVAPATANSLARMVHGNTEDMLEAVLLATEAPILVAPAMEHHMWHHPATQANIDTLCERGVEIISPETGRLASGASGDGRLADLDRLLFAVRRTAGRNGSLSGKKIVITAGGTYEAIDPVRFIGNSSSGTMGIEIAYAALDRGADVRLILGPSVNQPPACFDPVHITSAIELQTAVEHESTDADVLIMAAAVADFRPETASESKVKKKDGEDTWNIPLTKNPDILASINLPGMVKVGFAAETDDLLANAAKKLERKGLAMIIANEAVATIGSSTSTATILTRGQYSPESLPELSKSELASVIVDRISDILSSEGSE